MIFGYLYLIFLVAASAYVYWRGDPDAHFAMLVMFVGSLSTYALMLSFGSGFAQVEYGVLLIDVAAFTLLYRRALGSERFWPLWLAGLQLVNLTSHLAKMVAPDIVPRVYLIAQGLWAYPMIALLCWWTYKHHARRGVM
jgi:hypothetical protein